MWLLVAALAVAAPLTRPFELDETMVEAQVTWKYRGGPPTRAGLARCVSQWITREQASSDTSAICEYVSFSVILSEDLPDNVTVLAHGPYALSCLASVVTNKPWPECTAPDEITNGNRPPPGWHGWSEPTGEQPTSEVTLGPF